MRRAIRHSRQGGLLLDLMLGLAVIVVGAFLLYQVGLTFHTVLHGAERFFGF